MIRLFLQRTNFWKQKRFLFKPMMNFSRNLKGGKGLVSDSRITKEQEEELEKFAKDSKMDRNLEEMISQKIDSGMTDHEIINEFLGKTFKTGRGKISKEFKTKDKVTDKEIQKNESLSGLKNQEDVVNRLNLVLNS